jgi:hypothetical protein
MSAVPSPTLSDALDEGRFDFIAEYAHVASSLWCSAAARGERVTLIRHCRQAGDVSCEAFQVVKKLGPVEPA